MSQNSFHTSFSDLESVLYSQQGTKTNKTFTTLLSEAPNNYEKYYKPYKSPQYNQDQETVQNQVIRPQEQNTQRIRILMNKLRIKYSQGQISINTFNAEINELKRLYLEAVEELVK